ncbi:TIR domain-containing protein [Candidatus Palauibacter sp.]|uniref:TIR domain-containing protein n=1 Tax=Candidatus Palauibacter sp. TaxID=3101350 RepID=UPI003B523319
MLKRRVFYSFNYETDRWRAATVRNIGVVEGNRPATDTSWEELTRQGAPAIRAWIVDQMRARSCTVVLVGTHTTGRPWVEYEIEKSWKDGMGVVGIRIHGLRNRDGHVAARGPNPFRIAVGAHEDLSRVVKCYDPPGRSSEERYEWIRDNLANAVEEAIAIRHQSNMSDIAEQVVSALQDTAYLSRDIDNLYQMLDFPNEHLACIKKINAYDAFDLTRAEELLHVALNADPKMLRLPEIHKTWSNVVDTIRNSEERPEDKLHMRAVVDELERILRDSLG